MQIKGQLIKAREINRRSLADGLPNNTPVITMRLAGCSNELSRFIQVSTKEAPNKSRGLNVCWFWIQATRCRPK